LFDYIHRAMPYQAPGSLSVDDRDGFIPDPEFSKVPVPK
jgi:S-disulfanyl-L-cysteine oxidoreductase SoxD